MTKKIIYSITNPEYMFDQNEYPPINGYLIVGEEGNKACINHFGEKVKTHEEAIEWYKQNKISPKRVFINGKILKLMELKENFNKKNIKKVINELEKLLLK